MLGELHQNKNGKVGYIAFFDLEGWWQKTFTEEERKYIVEKYWPMGAIEGSLINEVFIATSQTCFPFLYTLASWFNNPNDRAIAIKIITKAEEYLNSEKNVITLHFFWPTKMKIFYRERENPSSLQEAINCCIKQIELAPAAAQVFRQEWGNNDLVHEGYDQLCIIYEKQGRFEDAIKLAEQAKKQGWRGDWDGRIARCRKKLDSSIKS